MASRLQNWKVNYTKEGFFSNRSNDVTELKRLPSRISDVASIWSGKIFVVWTPDKTQAMNLSLSH